VLDEVLDVEVDEVDDEDFVLETSSSMSRTMSSIDVEDLVLDVEHLVLDLEDLG